MNKEKQMSDSLIIGSLLAIVGGFLDAYTYLTRGHVFANAQTGNIVLLGVNMSNGNFRNVIEYVIPIAAFFWGIIAAELVKDRYKQHQVIHWRQIIIVIEIIILIIVAFIPQEINGIANAMVSFVCSLQVESFRKVNGNPYATTMCTGNLRSATEHLFKYFKNGDRSMLNKSVQYFYIILLFVIGACIGTVLSKVWQLRAVIVAIIPLLLIITLMNKKSAIL